MDFSLVAGGKGSVPATDAERGQPGQNGFIPVRLASLQVDTYAAFDLYVSQAEGGPYVLYREKNLQFTEESKLRLEQHNVSVLFVPATQIGQYRAYVEQELGHILTDPAVPIEEKSHILYDSAMSLSEEVFENPRSGNLFARCDGLVHHEVSFIIEQEGAFGNLAKVTSHDYYTYTHSVNVSLFSIATAHALGHDKDEILRIGNGALLHDIGKTMVPPNVLNCPGKLSDDAWRVMRLHPVYGYNILKRQGCNDGIILDMVRHHHERLTGKGYPDNLQSGDVSQVVRISMIADVFDALTTRRPYKNALSVLAAFQCMQSEMNTDLDSPMFRRFAELIGTSRSTQGQRGTTAEE